MFVGGRIVVLEALNAELTATNSELMVTIEALGARIVELEARLESKDSGTRRCRRRAMGVTVGNAVRLSVRPANRPVWTLAG